MQIWEVLLVSFGGTASALLTVAFLFKKLLGHWFNKNLEQYKLNIIQENSIALENLKSDLANQSKYEDRALKLQEIMNNYKGPLIHSAYELQSRIYNLVANRIIKLYFVDQRGDGSERDYIIKNTVFVIAQYYAWTEIIRREIQFIELDNPEATKEFSQIQDSIYSIWHSEMFDDPLMIWAGEQRGIGEIMTETRNDKLSCVGYSKFLKMLEENNEVLLNQLEKKVRKYIEQGTFQTNRLVPVQNSLIDLLEFLDPNYIRFPEEQRTYIT